MRDCYEKKCIEFPVVLLILFPVVLRTSTKNDDIFKISPSTIIPQTLSDRSHRFDALSKTRFTVVKPFSYAQKNLRKSGRIVESLFS